MLETFFFKLTPVVYVRNIYLRERVKREFECLGSVLVGIECKVEGWRGVEMWVSKSFDKGI